jgi:hypothetical protein
MVKWLSVPEFLKLSEEDKKRLAKENIEPLIIKVLNLLYKKDVNLSHYYKILKVKSGVYTVEEYHDEYDRDHLPDSVFSGEKDYSIEEIKVFMKEYFEDKLECEEYQYFLVRGLCHPVSDYSYGCLVDSTLYSMLNFFSLGYEHDYNFDGQNVLIITGKTLKDDVKSHPELIKLLGDVSDEIYIVTKYDDNTDEFGYNFSNNYKYELLYIGTDIITSVNKYVAAHPWLEKMPTNNKIIKPGEYY